MEFAKCCHCDRVLGPLDTHPAPPHYRRVSAWAAGWLVLSGRWWCNRCQPGTTTQLSMWDTQGESDGSSHR